MGDRPILEDEKIITCLRETYGLTVTQIEFLPAGYDSYAAVYCVQAGGQPYFLKVKWDTVDAINLLIARCLKEQGLEEVVAPLPTVTSEPWGKIDRFTLILYPYIDGKVGMDVGLSDSQWLQFGGIVKRLHAIQLPPVLLNRVAKEDFVPTRKWDAVVSRLQNEVGTRAFEHPLEKRFAGLWEERRQTIAAIVDRGRELGRMLQSKTPELVLCHADIHTANLLLDSQGKLFVVDWDQPIMSPRERDLMFMLGTEGETLFFQGYGKTEIDLLTMTFYCYTRAMEDIGGFAESVLLMEGSDETKQDSIEWFLGLFGPGGIVELAYELDRKLGI